MTDQLEWTGKVGNTWAEEWQRTDRSFGTLTGRLLEVARGDGFAQALDIGCGAGEISVELACKARSARVLGVDVSAELVEAARSRGDALANLRFEIGDASVWEAGEGERPDLVVSRHGVMFFDHPTGAFAHIARQTASGARLAFSCFRERGENGWVRALTSVLPAGAASSPNPDAPGPFAFGRRERVEAILAEAGWRGIGFEPIDYAMIAGEGDNAIEDALSYFQRIGPIARAAAALDGSDRAGLLARLRSVLEQHLDGDRVALPAACWIVTARAPD